MSVGRSWRLVVLAGAAVIPALAGCSGASEPAQPPSSTLSAPQQESSAAGESRHEQENAVKTAYTQFWPRSLAIPNSPPKTWRNALAEIAVDPQLTTTLEAMRRNKQAGVKPYGEVTTRISSVDVHGDRSTVIDCQDGSRSGQADAATGDRKTVGTKSIPIHAELRRDSADGRWKVSRLEYPGGQCR